MRFPLEIFDVVRAAFPNGKPVGVRVSATDWVEGGWDIEQTVLFAQELEKRGCSFIDVSSGGLSPLQKIPVGPGYQVPFATQVKNATGMPTIAVGLITAARQAEQILVSGEADIGKPLTRLSCRTALSHMSAGPVWRRHPPPVWRRVA